MNNLLTVETSKNDYLPQLGMRTNEWNGIGYFFYSSRQHCIYMRTRFVILMFLDYILLFFFRYQLL